MNILTSTLDSPRSLTRTRITSQNFLSFIRHFSLSSPHLILLPNNTLLCISVIIFSFLTPLCSDYSSTPHLVFETLLYLLSQLLYNVLQNWDLRLVFTPMTQWLNYLTPLAVSLLIEGLQAAILYIKDYRNRYLM